MKILLRTSIFVALALASVGQSAESLIKFVNLANRRSLEVDVKAHIDEGNLKKLSEIVGISPPPNFNKVFCVRVVRFGDNGRILESLNFVLKDGNFAMLIKKNDIDVTRNDRVIYLLL